MPALTEPEFVGLSLFRRLPFLRLLWAFRSAFGPTCTCPHTHTLRSRGRVAGFLLLSKATSAQLLRTQGHADAGGAKALARQEHAARPWGAPPLRGLPLCSQEAVDSVDGVYRSGVYAGCDPISDTVNGCNSICVCECL